MIAALASWILSALGALLVPVLLGSGALGVVAVVWGAWKGIKLMLAAGVLLLVIALGCLVAHYHGEVTAAQAERDKARGVAEAATRATGAVETRTAAAAQQQSTTVIYRSVARAAPATNACPGSPAVAGYLDGLRHAAAAGGGAPPVAPLLPARAGPAGGAGNRR